MKALHLANNELALVLLPELGGKIASLKRCPNGREWLWRNPHLPLAPPTYGVSYVRTLDSGGWDEIFPSVSPTVAEGFTIPDHGDLVQLPWAVTAQSASSVTMAVTTRFAPCRFERTLSLRGPTLRADYRVENRGSRPVPYLWCAHPLIALEPGMTIELPPGTPMRLAGGIGVSAGVDFDWPHAPGLPDLSRVPDLSAPGVAPFGAKLFTGRGAVSSVAIGAPAGKERLHLTWQAADAPYLGLWLNCRAWSGCGSLPYFNLGVEPATAPADDLAVALPEGSGRHLAPGEIRAWAVETRLEIVA